MKLSPAWPAAKSAEARLQGMSQSIRYRFLLVDSMSGPDLTRDAFSKAQAYRGLASCCA